MQQCTISITMREAAACIDAIYAAIEASNLGRGGFSFQTYMIDLENYAIADIAMKLQRLKYHPKNPKKVQLYQAQIDAVYRRTRHLGRFANELPKIPVLLL